MGIIILFVLTQGVWVETYKNDFTDGFYSCNLFVSMRDSGTIEFTSRWDLDADGYVDIAMANERTGLSYVYWGSASGYNPSNYTSYPVDGAQNCDVADINFDGYPELFFADPGVGTENLIRIFRGTSAGPDPGDYTDIQLYDWNECCYIADFNKDGFLDLAVSIFKPDSAAVFYGDRSGITDSTNTFPSSNGWSNVEAADFNLDGWLDIVIINGSGGLCYVYWGDAIGYHASRRDELIRPPGLPGGLSIATLNRDRYLDLVLPGWNGGNQAHIYTGSSAGFTLWQTLTPGGSFGGCSAADLNEDGFLDLLFVKGYGLMDWPVIYWGSTTGYSDTNRTEISVAVDGSGSLVYDFNRDGTLDIFINNYAYPPQESYILLGPDFSTQWVLLPTGRDCHSRFREIGNVYDRRYREPYVSSVYDATNLANWGTVEWDDSLPQGTLIDLMVKTGDTPNPDTTWSSWFTVLNGDSIPDSLNSQYIQYMALLRFTTPAYLPFLYEVRIFYEDIGISSLNNNVIRSPVTIAPNPFSKKTKISYVVDKPHSKVLIRIFDVAGRHVKTLVNEELNVGEYSIEWHGEDSRGRQLPEGTYHLKLKIGDKTTNIKTVYISN